jgi:hypothetical protein
MEAEKGVPDARLLEGLQVAAVEAVEGRLRVSLGLNEREELPRIALQGLIVFTVDGFHLSFCLTLT